MSLHLGLYGQTIQRILWLVGLTRRLFTLSHLFEMVKNPFVVLVSEFTKCTQPYVSNSSKVLHTLRGQGIEWCGGKMRVKWVKARKETGSAGGGDPTLLLGTFRLRSKFSSLLTQFVCELSSNRTLNVQFQTQDEIILMLGLSLVNVFTMPLLRYVELLSEESHRIRGLLQK